MTKLLLQDGLRIGKKELSLLQDLRLDDLASLVQSVTNAPAVITAAGVLGTSLQVTGVNGAGVSVAAGSALLANGMVLAVTGATSLAVADGVTNGSVVLSAVSTPFLEGTMALAADRVTLTYTGTLDLTTEFESNDYIRLDLGGDLGTFRVESVTSGGIVLAEVVSGTGTIAGLSYAPAGKFFPGYPLSGNTRDLLAIDSPSLRLEATNYTPLDTEIVLASVTRTGATVTVTDTRVAVATKTSTSSIVNADIAANAAIAGSKLDAATQSALAKAHVQNTDTYTTAATFQIGASDGPRAITTDDMPVPMPTAAGTWPAVRQELNVQTSFVRHSNGLALLKIEWGITGTAGVATNNGNGTQTVTISSPDLTPVSANALTGYVLYDAAGTPWAITANAASIGDQSFTVTTSTTDVAGDVGTITAGAATIQSSAANTRVEVVHKVNGVLDPLSTYMEPGVVGTFGYPIASKTLSFLMADAGETYTVTLTGARGGALATYTTDVTWGTNASTPTVNVASASITATATSSTVVFTWPAPTGFDSSTMDYFIAVVVDGAPNPAVFQVRSDVEDLGTGAGMLRVPCGPGQLVTATIRVVDLSGDVISTTDGTKQLSALPSGGAQYQKEAFPFSLTAADYNVTGTNMLDVTTSSRYMLGSYEIGAIEVDFDTFNVSPGTRFKVGVYPDGAESSIIWSDEMGDGAPTLGITPNQTSYIPLVTQVKSGGFSGGMNAQFECTNPSENWAAALTGMSGTIRIFYRPTTSA